MTQSSREALTAEAWSRWYALPVELKREAVAAGRPVPGCALALWAALTDQERARAVEDAGDWWAEHEALRVRERDGIDPDAGDAREPEEEVARGG